MKKIGLIQLLFLILVVSETFAQAFPVGITGLEDYARRKQLAGDSLQEASLMIRPSGSLYKNEGKAEFRLMPLVWKQQYNTDHPEGINDGAMIPARGYQTIISGGFYARYGIFSVQLMPEILYAGNTAFDEFPDEHRKEVWQSYNLLKRIIDLPDKFGDEPYKKIYWGQSNIRLTYKSLSLGISNENLWWGPGIHNSLLMSNNAPGFKHITFNTVKPLKTPIGKFEFQIIGGRLDASGYYGIDTVRLAKHGFVPFTKNESWRYINAMTINYEPKWMPGLSLGAARSFVLYSTSLNKSYRTWLPLFEPLLKTDVGGEVADTITSDQLASVWARWLMPESNSEVYLEFGREDHNWDLTDFILEPDHDRAYIAGFRKLIPFKVKKYGALDVQLELTQLSRNLSTFLRPANPLSKWYSHGKVFHGYTHNGQILGAGIGTSSNMQSVTINWVKDYKRIGFEFVRLAHDEDFWAFLSNNGLADYRTHWVDLSGALVADWNYKNLLINLKVQTVGSINYMFYYDPIPSDPPFWWDHGAVRYNVHAELSLVWLLNDLKLN